MLVKPSHLWYSDPAVPAKWESNLEIMGVCSGKAMVWAQMGPVSEPEHLLSWGVPSGFKDWLTQARSVGHFTSQFLSLSSLLMAVLSLLPCHRTLPRTGKRPGTFLEGGGDLCPANPEGRRISQPTSACAASAVGLREALSSWRALCLASCLLFCSRERGSGECK